MSLKKQAAIFTIAQNEPRFLRIWLDYYVKVPSFAGSIYILDHDSTDPEHRSLVQTYAKKHGVHIVPVHRSASFDHEWLLKTVEQFQRFLLQSYEYVLFTEADEIVVAEGGFDFFLEKAGRTAQQFFRCEGYNIVHDRQNEASLDWSKPVLAQRSWWSPSESYSKTLFSKIPLEWRRGFHACKMVVPPQLDRSARPPRLALIHLHRLDYEYCRERHETRTKVQWASADSASGFGSQNMIVKEEELVRWFYHPEEFGMEPIRLKPMPEEVKSFF